MSTKSSHEQHGFRKGDKSDQAEAIQYLTHRYEYRYDENASKSSIPRSISYPALPTADLSLPPNIPLALMNPGQDGYVLTSSSDNYGWDNERSLAAAYGFALPIRTPMCKGGSEIASAVKKKDPSTSSLLENLPNGDQKSPDSRISCPTQGCNECFVKEADLSSHGKERHTVSPSCENTDWGLRGTERAPMLTFQEKKTHSDPLKTPVNASSETDPGIIQSARLTHSGFSISDESLATKHFRVDNVVEEVPKTAQELGCQPESQSPLTKEGFSSLQQPNWSEITSHVRFKQEKPLYSFGDHFRTPMRQSPLLKEKFQSKCFVTPECRAPEVCNAPGNVNANISSFSVCETNDFLGIGAWALHVFERNSISPFFDLTSLDVQRILENEHNHGIVKCVGDSSTSKQAQNSTQSSQNYSSKYRSGSGNPQKRPCREKEDQEEDEDSENSKRPRIQERSTLIPDKKFACPYYKNERTRATHPACEIKCFADIARVKEHLYRAHLSPPNPCATCGGSFKTPRRLELHLGAGCRVRPEDPHDGITPDVKAKLKSRKKDGEHPSREELWFNIYHLIFPGDPVPTDPYQDQSAEKYFSISSKKYLPQLFEQGLDSIVRKFVPVQEDAECLSRLLVSHLSAAQNQFSMGDHDRQESEPSTSEENTDLTKLLFRASEVYPSAKAVNYSISMANVQHTIPPQALYLAHNFPPGDSVSLQSPVPPTPQLLFMQTPFSTSMSIRPTSSSESFTESGYGSGMCGNPDCIHQVGCVYCIDLSFSDDTHGRKDCPWNSNHIFSTETLYSKPSEKGCSCFLPPVTSIAHMDSFVDYQFSSTSYQGGQAREDVDPGN